MSKYTISNKNQHLLKKNFFSENTFSSLQNKKNMTINDY